MDEEDLHDLLARIALSDRGAFRALYARTGGKLFGVALRILNDRSDAEEAVQEAYVKVWHNAASFQASRGSPMAWLVSVVRNQAIDVLRARRAPARDVTQMHDLPDAAPTPEGAALAGDDRRRIRVCLDELPQDRARAVTAAYVEGYSYAELAQHYEVPLNTMRTWLRRALISLRECLGS